MWSSEWNHDRGIEKADFVVLAVGVWSRGVNLSSPYPLMLSGLKGSDMARDVNRPAPRHIHRRRKMTPHRSPPLLRYATPVSDAFYLRRQ